LGVEVQEVILLVRGAIRVEVRFLESNLLRLLLAVGLAVVVTEDLVGLAAVVAKVLSKHMVAPERKDIMEVIIITIILGLVAAAVGQVL
jgi:hypothetical protein